MKFGTRCGSSSRRGIGESVPALGDRASQPPLGLCQGTGDEYPPGTQTSDSGEAVFVTETETSSSSCQGYLSVDGSSSSTSTTRSWWVLDSPRAAL